MSPSAAQLTVALSKKKIPRGTVVRAHGGEWITIQSWVSQLRSQQRTDDGSIEAAVSVPPPLHPDDAEADESSEPSLRPESSSRPESSVVTGRAVPSLPDGLFVDLVEHPDHGLAAVVGDFFVLRRAFLGGLAFSACLLLGCLVGHRLGVPGLFGILGAAVGLAFALSMTGWVNNPQHLLKGVMKASVAILLVAIAGAAINSLLVALFSLVIGLVGGFGGAVGLVVLNSLLSLVYILLLLMLCVAALVIAAWLALNLIAGAAVDSELIGDLKAALQQPRTVLEAGLPTLFSLTFSGFIVGLVYWAFARFSDGAAAFSHQGVVDLEAGIQYLYGVKMSAGMGSMITVPSAAALISALVLTLLVALISATVFALPLLMMARAVMVYLPVHHADLRVARASALPKPPKAVDLPAYAPDPEEALSPQERRSQELASAVDQVEINSDLPAIDDDEEDGTLSISWGDDDEEVELETRGD